MLPVRTGRDASGLEDGSFMASGLSGWGKGMAAA